MRDFAHTGAVDAHGGADYARGMPKKVTPRPWLEARLGEVRKTKIDLARTLGINNSRIHEMIDGTRRIKVTEIDPMARFLEWSRQELMKLEATTGTRQDDDVGGEFEWSPDGARRTPDFPVYEAIDMGAGHFDVGARPATMTDRLPALQANTVAYATPIVTDVMSPALERGALLYIDPTDPAVPGDDVVFVHRSGRRCIRRLVEIVSDGWRVRQFNPPKSHTLALNEWPAAHRVVFIRKR